MRKPSQNRVRYMFTVTPEVFDGGMDSNPQSPALENVPTTHTHMRM